MLDRKPTGFLCSIGYRAFLLAVSHDQELADAYVSTSPYAVLPREFFSPAHTRAILRERGRAGGFEHTGPERRLPAEQVPTR